MRQSQLCDCCVYSVNTFLLLNWLISEVWAAVSINCCLCTSNTFIPKNISRKAEQNENTLGNTQYLMNRCLQVFQNLCIISSVCSSARSKSTHTNIIATVTTETATPRHIDLTLWNHWTTKAGKDLLDHYVQLLLKSPNPPCLGTNTHFWVSSPAP